MKKDGYSENTIEPIGRRLRNLAKHANLANPDEAKSFIAKADWSNVTRRIWLTPTTTMLSFMDYRGRSRSIREHSA